MGFRLQWVWLAFVVYLWTGNTQTPARFILSGGRDFLPEELYDSSVIYKDDLVTVVRNPLAEDRDFNDIYFVHGTKWAELPSYVQNAGRVLEYVPYRGVLMRIPDSKIAALSSRMHGEGLGCGGVVRLYGDPVHLEAIATPNPIVPVEQAVESYGTIISKVDSTRIKASIQELSDIETRFHRTPTGQNVAPLLVKKYNTIGTREDITVKTFDHGTKTKQPSLVVTIKGTEKPEELVILGSHIDSVNWEEGSGLGRAPGADDNASGTATNMEIFTNIIRHKVKFKRTVEIHGYAAEEVGLVGSQHMAQIYRNTNRNVISMMQLDMDLYRQEGDIKQVWFIKNGTHDGLNKGLASLVDLYVKIPHSSEILDAGDSDHSSWRRQGFAVAFPTENPNAFNNEIHTRRDTLQHGKALDLAESYAKLGLAYLLHYAGGIRE